MFLPFLYALRARKVPVGTQEAIALARALGAGLHDSSLEGFYHVARALLVHSEAHLDAFDQTFLEHFHGATDAGLELSEQLLEWLKDARQRRDLREEERRLLEALDVEALEQLLRERLAQQKARHDGGPTWVGTGGTSPFGNAGYAGAGIRIGGQRLNRSGVRVAGERRYAAYRGDLVLDTRQLAVALRKLRAFSREGRQDELDVEGTIAATARNAGELEVVTRPPRKPNTRVVLLMDVGGSMDPYAHLVSRLFSAAKAASHFRELRTYYFHNCVYGRLYETATFRGGTTVPELTAQLGRHYKLVVVGDALMAPYELSVPTRADGTYDPQGGREGLGWLQDLARHFERSVWLNPEPQRSWRGTTIQVVASVFNMFPLTLEGLDEAVAHLTRGKGARRG